MKKNTIIGSALLALSIFSAVSSHAQVNSDSTVNVAFGQVQREDLLGGVSTIDVEELLKKNYAVYSLDNVQSFIGGFTGNVWGQGALVLVDGVPRSAADIRLVEVS